MCLNNVRFRITRKGFNQLASIVKLDAPVTRTAKPIARKAEDTLAARAAATVRSSGVR